jgi:hypothetical protein
MPEVLHGLWRILQIAFFENWVTLHMPWRMDTLLIAMLVLLAVRGRKRLLS